MEEKDQQPLHEQQPDKPVEEKPQPPLVADIKTTGEPAEPLITLHEPVPQTSKQPETPDMEVHHHSHAHGKKNWKAYFWEFLMLFLAVFCGFLAEYQLEHKIERDKGKEMIVSLIEDLKKDTALLNTHLSIRKENKIAMDSLVILLTAPDIKERGADIYFCGRRIFRFTFPRYTDRTIQQLKNAGSFRLIKNSKTADSILKYYSLWEGIIFLQNQAQERVGEFIVSTRQVFDPLVFEAMVNDQTENRITRPEGNPSLLTYNKDQMISMISIIHNLKSSNRRMQLDYVDLKNEAAGLIEFLKKEYHLE